MMRAIYTRYRLADGRVVEYVVPLIEEGTEEAAIALAEAIVSDPGEHGNDPVPPLIEAQHLVEGELESAEGVERAAGGARKRFVEEA